MENALTVQVLSFDLGHLAQLHSGPQVQLSPQLHPVPQALQPSDLEAPGLAHVLQVQSAPQAQFSPQLQPVAHSLHDIWQKVLRLTEKFKQWSVGITKSNTESADNLW